MSRPCYVTINHHALLHNVAVLKKKVGEKCRLMAMVKADAYGHGLSVITEKLTEADAFGVACLEEALVLRKNHPQARIVLMEGFFDPSEFALIVEHQLDCVIHCIEQIELFEKERLSKPVVVWLKVNTGMHRLGVPLSRAYDLWHRLRQNPNVKGDPLLMTHLAQADSSDKAPTAQQLERFNSIRQTIKTQYSIANSAAILVWPETHVDWVRPGITLYGISPFTKQIGADYDLQPVMTLHSQIIAIQDCKAGDRVGYGGDWVCPTPMRVGIVAVGYGDGYPRHAKSGTPVLVKGQIVHLIGRVSMDMIAVDLTPIPHCTVGDPVVLWGDGLPIERVAAHADTIAYELVCNITPRVRRVVTCSA